ncbi:MAG: sugar phosphate isomerase/epimerase [Lachnospiraceae bacterium]|nr:sugar phosphate isomerase/epimerase [Lachnospiraceae bacterium]
MIRLGICTSIDRAAAMKAAGFDYVELSLSQVTALSDEEFEALAREVDAAPLPVEAMNSMMPGTYRILTKEGTPAEVYAFLEKGFTRAERLGVKVIVFGAGGARRLPDDMTMEEGLQGLTVFLKAAGELAEKHGLRIAVEPLRAEETNIVNYVREAQALAKRAGRGNIGALADLYHMMCGNDSYEDMEKGLIHCHIAERKERAWPRWGDGSETDYRAFFGALKRSQYDGRVSIEGRAPEDFEEAARASYALLSALAN